jgi:phosphoenolpyruvate synthase/pyruvate phosphate dikinase
MTDAQIRIGFPGDRPDSDRPGWGKGANLGELSRIEGIRVPAGLCVTTDAFKRIMEEATSIDDRLDQLSRLTVDDHEAIRALSAEIRRTIEGIAMPAISRRDWTLAVTIRRARHLRGSIECDCGRFADRVLRRTTGLRI